MLEEKEGKDQPTVKRKLRVGRLVLLLFVVSMMVIGSYKLGQGVYYMFFTDDLPVTVRPSGDTNSTLVETLDERINVLVLGIDDGESASMEGEFKDEPKRTDAMLLVSFSPDQGKVSVLSIPRDTRVNIPGRRWPDKINHAYAYGGVELAKKTVANLLQIPVHYYMLADWRGFIEVIDLIGGVDMYVDKDMNYEDPYANLEIHLKKGYQHLSGEDAGKYVRFRHDELGDIGRVQRQQKFLKALAGEIFTVSTVVKLPSIVATAGKYIETDLDTMTMLKAANSFKLFGGEKVKAEMLMGDFRTINEISYWQTTPNLVEKTLGILEIPHRRIPGATRKYINKAEDNND